MSGVGAGDVRTGEGAATIGSGEGGVADVRPGEGAATIGLGYGKDSGIFVMKNKIHQVSIEHPPH